MQLTVVSVLQNQLLCSFQGQTSLGDSSTTHYAAQINKLHQRFLRASAQSRKVHRQCKMTTLQPAQLILLLAAAAKLLSITSATGACHFLPKPQPVLWNCDAAEQWNLDTARQHAVRHAPILHMHPAEDYLLTDPLEYWSATKLYNKFYEPQDRQTALQQANNSDLAYSFITVLPPNGSTALDTVEEQERRRAIISGSGVDANGRSKARVFYQLLQDHNAWVYTYNLYYTWNGCANYAYATSVGPDTSSIEYTACPDSTHEADWEHVSVVVCPGPDGGTPVAALLSQHNHNQLFDCRTDSNDPNSRCNWEQGDDGKLRLSVYPALHSHANLPAPSNGTVNAQITNGADALYYVDRAADGGVVFMPSAANILPVPGAFPDIPLNYSDPDTSWSLYPGWWGVAEYRLPGRSITCLSPNRTSFSACPANVAWQLVAGKAGIPYDDRDVPLEQDITGNAFFALPSNPEAVMPFNYHQKGGAKQAPLHRPWAHHFTGARLPPLYDFPAHNPFFRILLNGGSVEPPKHCLLPTQMTPQAYPSSTDPNMHTGLSLSFLLSIPLTLLVAYVGRRVVRDLHSKSLKDGLNCCSTHSQPIHQQQHQLTGARACVPRPWLVRLRGALTAYHPPHGRYQPIPAGHTAPEAATTVAHHNEVELGETVVPVGPAYSSVHVRRNSLVPPASDSFIHASATPPQSTTESTQTSPIRNHKCEPAVNAWHVRCLQSCMVMLSEVRWLGVRAVAFQLMYLSISCLSAVIYMAGIRRVAQVTRLSLTVSEQMASTVRDTLAAVAISLVIGDAALVIFHCFQMPDSSTSHNTHAPWAYDGHKGDSDDELLDPNIDIPIPAQGEDHQLKVIKGAPSTIWPQRVCKYFVMLVTTVLITVAVVFVGIQTVVQAGCQMFILQPNKHQEGVVSSDGRAFFEVPGGVGAVSGGDGPGHVYAATICLRWRDDFGAGLLTTASITWGVLHIIALSGRARCSDMQ